MYGKIETDVGRCRGIWKRSRETYGRGINEDRRSSPSTRKDPISFSTLFLLVSVTLFSDRARDYMRVPLPDDAEVVKEEGLRRDIPPDHQTTPRRLLQLLHRILGM